MYSCGKIFLLTIKLCKSFFAFNETIVIYLLTLTLKNKAMPKKTPKMMMSSSALAKKAESARISEKQKQDIQARVTGKKPKGTIPVKKKGM